jgi:hypothetical protein
VEEGGAGPGRGTRLRMRWVRLVRKELDGGPAVDLRLGFEEGRAEGTVERRLLALSWASVLMENGESKVKPIMNREFGRWTDKGC